MNALQVAILAILALMAGQLSRGRQLVILALSALAVFWLQSEQPFASLLFWLPVATLGIAVFGWVVTTPSDVRSWRQNWPAVVVLAAVILMVALNRYFGLAQIFAIRTPALPFVLAALLGMAGLILLLARWESAIRVGQAAMFIGILLMFIFLKTPPVMHAIEAQVLGSGGANPADRISPLAWLGFSYLAFRVLHTIRDRQSGRMPTVTLSEYVNYVIFFPSFTAGPIDRVERFVTELRVPLPLADADWFNAGTRLMVGLFKKFVLADLLAVISINDVLVAQVKTAGWLWLFLYAYAFRIYFDFSGYTDVAIGMGRLMGIRLPENFAAPYLKSNVTKFWNSWHMTLTQWFRSYFFNPLTRSMRASNSPLPAWLIMMVIQVSTMILIGLWHGVTWGFVAWGLWHGIGLFIHNRWSFFIGSRMPAWTQTHGIQVAMNLLGVFLTFNYVALGWLFFNLSAPAIAWQAMQKLFGLA